MDDRQGQQSTGEGAQQKPAYGFYLVLAAIVVVAIMYSVTLLLIGDSQRTPETVFGAMAASFTVIGTLVGTYFGIKAGLDGQDKVKQALTRAGDSSIERPQVEPERNGGRRIGASTAEEPLVGPHEPRVRRRGDSEDRQGWEGGGV